MFSNVIVCLTSFKEVAQVDEVDYSSGSYGNVVMNQSQEKLERSVLRVGDLGTSVIDKKIWARGRLHTSRAKGKQCFFLLRQQQSTVQCLLAVSESTSKAFVKFVAG
jgi:hypothetical protein